MHMRQKHSQKHQLYDIELVSIFIILQNTKIYVGLILFTLKLFSMKKCIYKIKNFNQLKKNVTE